MVNINYEDLPFYFGTMEEVQSYCATLINGERQVLISTTGDGDVCLSNGDGSMQVIQGHYFNGNINEILSEMERLKETVTSNSSTVEEMSGRIDTVSNKVQENTNKVNELNTTISSNTDRINQLDSSVQTNTNNVNNIKTDINNVKGDMGDIKNSFNTHNGRITSLEQTSSNHSQKISALENRPVTSNLNLENAESNSVIMKNAQNSNLGGTNCMIIGRDNVNSGNESILLGKENKNNSNYCLIAGYYNKNEHVNTFMYGSNNKSSSMDTICGGYLCEASGMVNVVLGSVCKAKSNFSVAIGVKNVAEGQYSTALGRSTIAMYSQTALGANNKINGMPDSINTSSYLFVVGNGVCHNDPVENDKGRNTCFAVRNDGRVYADGSFYSTGADIGEYFEWEDGNLDNEDRIGYFVSLNGDKISKATSNSKVIGIISGTASIVGDAYNESWQGKFIKDDFGRVQYKEYTTPAEYDDNNVLIADEAKVISPIRNSQYDAKTSYVPREKRPEWDIVGIKGKIIVRDDGTCTVGQYCKSNDQGIATHSSEETKYYVMERIKDNIIRVYKE